MKRKLNITSTVIRFIAVFIALLAFSNVAQSATKTWTGGTGTGMNWTIGTNWSGNTAPIAGDDIVFNTAGTITFSTLPGANIAYNSITINQGNITLAGTTRTFTLGGNAGVDFTIDNGASLTTTNVNITLANNATATIDGILTVSTGRTFNTNGTAVVSTVTGSIINNGTVTCTNATKLLFNDGSTYQHAINGGTIPTATWDANSNCNITGVTGTVPTVASFAQAFGNFTWNCTGQTANISLNGNLTDVNGNLTISSTNTGSLRLSDNGTTATLDIAGNFSQTGGNFYIAGTAGACTMTVTLHGNFSLSGGTFNINGSTGTEVLNVAGNFSQSAGTITETSTGSSVINFNGGTNQTYSKSGGTIANTINFTVQSGTTLDVGTSLIDGSTGTFTLNSGAGIITANTGGISTTGATGSIQVGGTRTYSTGANYTYNGTSAQVTGNGLTQNTPANVTIFNGAGVTLSAATTISGMLTMTSGTLNMADLALTVGSLSGAGNLTNTTGGTTARTITIGSDDTSPAAYSGIISNGTNTGGVSVEKVGTGTLILSSANTYTGLTTITGGVLQYSTDNALATGDVALNGGTLSTGVLSGYIDNVGTLDVNANSTIALGIGAHSLNFAASNGVIWAAGTTLTITGWTGNWDGTTGTSGKIFVGNSASGLNATQLAQVFFYNGTINIPAKILSTGEVVPDISISVAVAPASVLENSGSGMVFTFTRTGTTTGSLDFNFSVGGTATLSTDYSVSGANTFTATTGTATFLAGSSTKTITITPTSDATSEFDETIILTITSGTGYAIATPSAGTATITDDDLITVQPVDRRVCPNGNTTFSITTAGTCRWQVLNTANDNAVVPSWTDLNNTGIYTGVGTNTLTLTNITSAYNKYQYRCRVTSGSITSYSNAATLYVGLNVDYTLSADNGLINIAPKPAPYSSILTLSGSQTGVNYQLRTGTTNVGSVVAGNGGPISFASVMPANSTNYNVLATGCTSISIPIISTKTIVVNNDNLIIDLNPCAGQPGVNFFTNSEFGTTTSNHITPSFQASFPGVSFGAALGTTYTPYNYGVDGGNEVNDNYYVVANSTSSMYRPPRQTNEAWMLVQDKNDPGNGNIYIVNAAYTPGEFYTETLFNLCDSTKYEFSADIINVINPNHVPYGRQTLNYYNTDAQGNATTILPNIDFLINDKVALNTSNLLNDGQWHTFGFTFRTGGLSSIKLTIRNNSVGGIGNDLALDNIVMRACGPSIALNILTSMPVCPGVPVSMTAQILASDYHSPVYQWQRSTDGGVNWINIAGANSTTYTENNPVNGEKYRFITGETIPSLTNPYCHVASNPVTIITTADILSTTSATRCSPGTVTLGATANSGATINWYADATGGTSLSTGTSYITPSLSTTTTYYVDATKDGCTSSPRVPIEATVFPATVPASVSIVANPGTTLCSGNTVVFTATPTNGNTSPLYQWRKNGVDIVGATGVSYTSNTLSNNDKITCRMTVNPANTCITGSPVTSNELTMSVVASLAPSVTIAASPSNTICSGSSVTFTATPTNGGAIPTYQWKLNGSNVGSNSSTYTNTTLNNGDQITCVMTSSFACASPTSATSSAVTMVVNTSPQGSLSANGPFCATGAGQLTWTATAGTGPFTIVYKENGGVDRTASGIVSGTPFATNTTPVTATTTYTLVSVTGANSCVRTTGFTGASATITVNATPTATAGGPNTVCQSASPTAITLSGASVGGGATTGAWSITSGGGTLSSTAQTATPATVTYTPAANYSGTVTLLLTSNAGSGCTAATSSRTINVNALSVAPTSITGTTTICNGSSTTLTAAGGTLGTGANYQWGTGAVVGTNPIAGATSVSYTTPALSSSTTYWVYITNTTAPCTSTTSGVTQLVTVNQPSVAPTGITGTTTVCNGSTTTLTATGGTLGTGANYQWGTGAVVGTNPIAGATSVSYTTPVLSGNTTYWVRIANTTAPCTATTGGVTQLVTVNPFPAVNSTATGSICSGVAQNYDITSATGGTTYSWGRALVTGISNAAVSNQTSDPITETLINTTSAPVNVVYLITPTASGCTGSVFTYTVTVNPTPTLTGASLSAAVCAGTPATINLTGLVPSSTSTVAYSINGVAQTPATGVTANVSGAASFTTGNLTFANNGQTLRITGITVTSATPNCSATFTQDVTLQVHDPSISITTTYSEDCPELIGAQGFQPDNSGYDAGATRVFFSVIISGTTSTNWSFDYNVSGSNVVVRTGTEPGGHASPNPSSGTGVAVTGSNTKTMEFYINNSPGNALIPALNVTSVTVGGCTNSATVTRTVNIKAMPVVGSFN
jgi:hypothetical protein